jgi:signal transduction histidine kinase
MRTAVLHDLLIAERSAILAQCEEKVLRFGGALAAHPPALGWAVFYDDLVQKLDQPGEFTAILVTPSSSTSSYTNEFVAHGYTVSEVVHSYGILSQSISDLAEKAAYVLSPGEYAQLNLSLGNVIAEAVTAYDKEMSAVRDLRESQRLGMLAHELRNSLQAATISLDMISSGSTGTNSNTSDSLQKNLQRMGELIDTTLTEVRMRIEPEVHLVDVPLINVISEIATTAGFVARTKGIKLVIHGHYDLVIHADRQLVISALSNIVQNALKYSHDRATVTIRAVRNDEKVTIEVSDQCGGLPPGAADKMFKPFTQYSSDRSGIGLGLAISYNAIKRCKGDLSVRDMPGKGCVFVVELPAGKVEALGFLAPPR